MSSLKRSRTEEIFWQNVETLIGAICSFIKKLLSQCSYNNYASFRGLNEDELPEVFEELECYVRSLSFGSAEHELLSKLLAPETLTLENISNFRLKMHTKSSIRAIFKVIKETSYEDFIHVPANMNESEFRMKPLVDPLETVPSNTTGKNVNRRSTFRDKTVELNTEWNDRLLNLTRTYYDPKFPDYTFDISLESDFWPKKRWIVVCPVPGCNSGRSVYAFSKFSNDRESITIKHDNFRCHLQHHRKVMDKAKRNLTDESPPKTKREKSI